MLADLSTIPWTQLGIGTALLVVIVAVIKYTVPLFVKSNEDNMQRAIDAGRENVDRVCASFDTHTQQLIADNKENRQHCTEELDRASKQLQTQHDHDSSIHTMQCERIEKLTTSIDRLTDTIAAGNGRRKHEGS